MLAAVMLSDLRGRTHMASSRSSSVVAISALRKHNIATAPPLQRAGLSEYDLEFYRDPAKGTPHLRGKYEHWRPRGAWQTEGQFSDGTLRLLGLLWAVLDRTGPLLAPISPANAITMCDIGLNPAE
jgi:hypothetical protein